MGRIAMEGGKIEAKPKKVQLFEVRGPTSRFIHARIEDNGNLVIEG